LAHFRVPTNGRLTLSTFQTIRAPPSGNPAGRILLFQITRSSDFHPEATNGSTALVVMGWSCGLKGAVSIACCRLRKAIELA
jgi:hypothetical protein